MRCLIPMAFVSGRWFLTKAASSELAGPPAQEERFVNWFETLP